VREAKKKLVAEGPPDPYVLTSAAGASSSATEAASSSLHEQAISTGPQQTPSKKRKLFDFLSRPTPSAGELTVEQDVARDFQRFLDSPAASLDVFNDQLFARSLRPIALQLFSAPCSSAASERVFSQAGLIMRPTRSRLSRSRLSELVFLKCNRHM